MAQLRSAMKRSPGPPTPQASPSPPAIPLPCSNSLEVQDPATLLSVSSSTLGYSSSSSPAPTIPSSSSSSPHITQAGTPISLSPLQHQHSHVQPPATPGYTSKVSFDTFENKSASMFSFTLAVKSEGYARSRSTRVFLCASSPDESGREALDWCLETLVQDGDELIICRGVDEDVLEKDHNIVRGEARELMKAIQEKSVNYDPDRKLSLILEYIPGRITDTIDRLISLYRPDSVVVGTRGKRSVLSGLALKSMGGAIGSVSKYCLTHSPVPIIVVRPERNVRKNVEKRRADPKRGTHFESGE